MTHPYSLATSSASCSSYFTYLHLQYLRTAVRSSSPLVKTPGLGFLESFFFASIALWQCFWKVLLTVCFWRSVPTPRKEKIWSEISPGNSGNTGWMIAWIVPALSLPPPPRERLSSSSSLPSSTTSSPTRCRLGSGPGSCCFGIILLTWEGRVKSRADSLTCLSLLAREVEFMRGETFSSSLFWFVFCLSRCDAVILRVIFDAFGSK